MSVNKVILVGRLGAEPESRSFPNGGSICNLRLATTESWKDKQSGERKERTEWHRITLNNHLGNIAQKYLHKGAQIYIEGRIQTRKWQDQSGADRYSTEIIANNMTMLDARRDGEQAQHDYAPPQPNQQQAQVNNQFGAPHHATASEYAAKDDDIPF